MKRNRILLCTAALCMLCGCGQPESAPNSSSTTTLPTETTVAVSQTPAAETTLTEAATLHTETSLPSAGTTAAGSETVTAMTTAPVQTTLTSTQSSIAQTAKTTKDTKTETSSAAQTSADKSAQIAAAQAEVDRLSAEFSGAQTALVAARDKLTATESAYDTAKAEYTRFAAEHEDALALYSKGSFGFFSYVGAADALDVLQNADYAFCTVIGDAADATSLDNMRASFDLMRECNALRAGEGLPPLKVTDRLMAIAQSNLNWSDGHVQHSQQFSVGENLAWNYSDPFTGWYDGERETRGGHYMNIINESYTLTGFAVCTANRSGNYDISHGQVFLYETGEPSFTVDEYEARFDAYFESIRTAQEELDNRSAEVSHLETELSVCTMRLSEAEHLADESAAALQHAKEALQALSAN